MGEESPLKKEQIDDLIRAVEKNINIDRLLLLSMAKIDRKISLSGKNPIDKRLTVAVARDQAFCFYYQDNFDLFAETGIDTVFFSPLHDTSLPENIDGIYIGGGYPELYADKLSSNKEMLKRLHSWVEFGGLLLCECGGFMYMSETLIDLQGVAYPMVGVFPATISMNDRLRRLGYREATLTEDCFLGKKGDFLYGHEFHYSTVKKIDRSVKTVFQLQDGKKEGYVVKNALGGYLHLHFGQTKKNLEYLYNSLNKRKRQN
jgi:cobyrinic acid a,c-diamide synthase